MEIHQDQSIQAWSVRVRADVSLQNPEITKRDDAQTNKCAQRKEVDGKSWVFQALDLHWEPDCADLKVLDLTMTQPVLIERKYQMSFMDFIAL